MKIIMTIILGALILLSIIAGATKALQMPQEVQFFAAAGLGVLPMICLGTLQILAGLFAIFQKFRALGLTFVVLGFFVSVLVIAMTGNMPFAAFSMLPVLVGIFLLVFEMKRRPAAR